MTGPGTVVIIEDGLGGIVVINEDDDFAVIARPPTVNNASARITEGDIMTQLTHRHDGIVIIIIR